MFSSSYMVGILTVLLAITSVFMILLVLIQRGRGGGLAGAFGGMGGQSAFGTRAGDVFTKITVVVAIIFILLSALLGVSMRGHQRDVDTGVGGKFDAPATIEPGDADSVGEEAEPVFGADDAATEAAAESDDAKPAEDTAEADSSEESGDTETPAEGESDEPAETPAAEETSEPAEESTEETSSE